MDLADRIVMKDWCLFTGSAHPALAKRIAARAGLPFGRVEVERFPDGEIRPRVQGSLKGRGAIIVQPTCPPVNDHLVELILSIDSLLDAGAQKVVTVVPYFGYARQCKRDGPGDPLSAKVIAQLIEKVGADAIVVLDIHDPTVLERIKIPFVHVRAEEIMARVIRARFPPESNLAIVAPDGGGAERAQRVANLLGLPAVALEKKRDRLGSRACAGVQHCSVDLLEGKSAVIVDDMVTTGSTLVAAVHALRREGADLVGAVCTHGVLSPEAIRRLEEAHLPWLAVSDSLPVLSPPLFLQQFSVAPLLAKAVVKVARRVAGERPSRRLPESDGHNSTTLFG